MLSIVAMATARPASQQAKELKEPTATVAGRVTIGGKPAPGVMVMLLPYANYANNQAVARGNTDEDGRFRLSRVPAGRYAVRSFAPAFVSDGDEPIAQPEKLIVISDGETIEGINLALKRGGVITGRVTDASGRPMIEEQVILYFMNEQEQKRPYYPANNFSMRTDDRGVYRLYGLPAQRYLVSVGSQSEYGGSRMGNGGRSYPLTFHPGVTDESKATIVDLPQGGEVTGVDIIMGRADRSYKATGRIVDADTGKPLADISYGYGALDPKRKMLRFSSMGFRSDQKGEFRLEDLLPGHYAVFATPGEGNEYYSEQAVFEVVDQDISGVEMKLRRGCAVSGSVVVEGASLQDVYSKLQRATIYFSIARPEVSYASSGRVKFGPDGSFRIQGLSPGKAVFRLSNWEQNTGFSLLRVERDGIQQRDGIELSAGAHSRADQDRRHGLSRRRSHPSTGTPRR
jgi:hypothetical protein